MAPVAGSVVVAAREPAPQALAAISVPTSSNAVRTARAADRIATALRGHFARSLPPGTLARC